MMPYTGWLMNLLTTKEIIYLPIICVGCDNCLPDGPFNSECPGKKEMLQGMHKIGVGIPYWCNEYEGLNPPTVNVNPKRWARTRGKYMKSNPSTVALTVFDMVNMDISS